MHVLAFPGVLDDVNFTCSYRLETQPGVMSFHTSAD